MAHKQPPIAPPSESFVAAVDSDGTIREVDGAQGARYLKTNTELLALAQEFLNGPEFDLSFLWKNEESPWLAVTFERERPVDGADFVTVIITDESPPFGLTARELDVLTLVAGGLSNSEIADATHTSARTIGTHVEHLLRKTGSSNRAALAALAVRHGIFRLPAPGRPNRKREGGLHPASVLTTVASVPSPRTSRIDRRPLIVGTAAPLHGLGAADGHEMRNGAALAIAEINARGGVGGRPLRQIVVDVDIADPVSIQRSFEELIGSEVDAITTGYFFADDVVIDLAIEYGAPYLHAMTSEASTAAARESGAAHIPVFQVCPSETMYGPRFISFLSELRDSGQWTPPNRDVIFIESTVPGGQIASLDTFRIAEQGGWNIVRSDFLPSSVDDWAPIVSDIARSEPAAVMITHFVPEQLAQFQRQFAASPSRTLVYAVYTPSIPEFMNLAGSSVEGLLWSTVSGTYADQLGRGFLQRYDHAFGRPPGRSHAGIAYDEVHLLAQAWGRVDNPRSFREVSRQLRAATYRGVNGSYFLDNSEQSAVAYPDLTLDPSLGQAHLIFQVQEGKHRILSPQPYSDAGFRLPGWYSR
jgi:branched-chain amino acid transport system substrate-binding protein